MILCCGEALIDMVPTAIDGTTAYLPCAGGAVFNTAIALGRLGAPVGLLSGVSHDAFGQLLAETLTRNNVSTDMLIRSDRLTTLAVVHLKEGSATYAFYDAQSAGRMLDIGDIPVPDRGVEALFFGGISLVGEPAADAYADLLNRERAGRVVMVDPNIRPDFIADEPRYRQRIKRMIAQSDIVKVSDEDLAWLSGGGTIQDQAHQILDQGPRFVLVTQGAEGAVAFGPDGSLSQPAIPAQCVDSIGAGDTFNAGFLAALRDAGRLTPAALAGMSVQDLGSAMAQAAQAAAITVSRVGANPPWEHELRGR